MPRVRTILAAAAGIYLVLLLLDRFVLVELLLRRLAVPLIFAAIEAFAIFAVGAALRRTTDPARDFLVGYPIFGTLCFLAGLLHISRWSMLPLLFIGASYGIYLTRRRPITFAAMSPAALTATGLIVLTLACGFVVAQAPPVSLDELAYHLAVPRIWVAEGRAIDLPLLSHSYFPLGIESADLPLFAALGADGAIASHLLHLLAAIAATILAYRLTRRRAATTTALVITAGIVTTPAIAVAAGWSIDEWPLLGTCAALLLAIEDDDERSTTVAIAAGLLTKYTFIPFAAIVLIATRRWRGAAIGALIGSVFFVRNLVLTGNPIAPFLGADAPHVAGYRGAPLLSSYVFDGSFIDEALGASMMSLCAWAGGGLPWLLIAAGFVLFLLAPSARLLVPFFALPATRSGPAIEAWKYRRAMLSLILLAAGIQTFLVVYYTEKSEAFALLGGRLADHEYVLRQRPSVATIEALDAALPESSRTLVVGLGETFWFRHRVRGGGNFDGDRVSRYLDAGPAEALRARLRRDGITHVAIVSPQIATAVDKKREERQTILSPAAQRTLVQMLDRYGASVTARGNATLFTLRP